MGLKEQLIKFFERNRDQAFSGTVLANKFGVSRSAIWKAIHSLETDGYQFNTNKDYTFLNSNDIISKEGIESYCGNKEGLNVFQEVTSTNLIAKGLIGQNVKEAIIIANEQSLGRGRLGRSFYSPAHTGLYVSFLFKAREEEGAFVTIRTVVAVCKALENFIECPLDIKWVNDIFYHQKKVVGILCEMSTDLESGEAQYIVAGIGINVKEAVFPDDIKDVAGSLAIKESRNKVAAYLIECFNEVMNQWTKEHVLEFYRKRMLLIDKEVSYKKNNNVFKGIVRGINNEGALIIEDSDGEHYLNSGEVSIGSQEIFK